MFPSIRGSGSSLKLSFQNPTSSTQPNDHYEQTNCSVKPELPLMTRELDSMELETITKNHQQNEKQKRREQLMISGSSHVAQSQAAEHIIPVDSHGGSVGNKARRSGGVKVRRHLTSVGASVKLPHQTANKFFGLHEMLGFQDVNQTMEWLLTQSEAAIKGIPDSFSYEADGTESPSSCSG